MPGVGHAFTVPDSPAGLGRLVCLIGPPPDGVAGGILEVVAETPAEMIRVRSRSTNPIGKRVVTLTLARHRNGLRATLGVRALCPRAEEIFVEDAWRKRLDAWLTALAAALEGRVPWPSLEMPAEVRDAWRDEAVLADRESFSAAAFIRASAPDVWQTIRSPDTPRLSQRAIYSGYVPGSPQRQPGEMIYQVRSHPADVLAATISLAADLAEEQWVLMRRVGRPRAETLTSLQPADGGTNVTLTRRLAPGSSGEVQEQVAAELQSRLGAYQHLLEQGE